MVQFSFSGRDDQTPFPVWRNCARLSDGSQDGMQIASHDLASRFERLHVHVRDSRYPFTFQALHSLSYVAKRGSGFVKRWIIIHYLAAISLERFPCGVHRVWLLIELSPSGLLVTFVFYTRQPSPNQIALTLKAGLERDFLSVARKASRRTLIDIQMILDVLRESPDVRRRSPVQSNGALYHYVS